MCKSTTATAADFSRVYRLGTVPIGSRNVSVFVKATYKDGRLSISGVEGPKRNGDAVGSCGQIGGHLSPEGFSEFAPGWDAELCGQFLEAWERWHLNDMRPGCEHQRDWNASEPLELVSYGLTTEASQNRRRLQEMAGTEAARGVLPELDETERALLLLDDWFKPRFSPPDADDALSGCYEVRKRETKPAGHVHPEEHSRGLLGKPCEVCGYKYGTKWLREEVPAEVLEFLQSLPETDQAPAWV